MSSTRRSGDVPMIGAGLSASPVIEMSSSNNDWRPANEKSGFAWRGLTEDLRLLGLLVAETGDPGSGVLLRPVNVDQKAFMTKIYFRPD